MAIINTMVSVKKRPPMISTWANFRTGSEMALGLASRLKKILITSEISNTIRKSDSGLRSTMAMKISTKDFLRKIPKTGSEFIPIKKIISSTLAISKTI